MSKRWTQRIKKKIQIIKIWIPHFINWVPKSKSIFAQHYAKQQFLEFTYLIHAVTKYSDRRNSIRNI